MSKIIIKNETGDSNETKIYFVDLDENKTEIQTAFESVEIKIKTGKLISAIFTASIIEIDNIFIDQKNIQIKSATLTISEK